MDVSKDWQGLSGLLVSARGICRPRVERMQEVADCVSENEPRADAAVVSGL